METSKISKNDFDPSSLLNFKLDFSPLSHTISQFQAKFLENDTELTLLRTSVHELTENKQKLESQIKENSYLFSQLSVFFHDL